MTADPGADRSTGRYAVRFSATVAVLVVATLVLVLFVLPRRYVFSSGLLESGVSFPVTEPPPNPMPMVHHAAPPPAPAAATSDTLPPAPGPAERFWAEAGPLLRAGAFERAFPLFRSYLGAHPDDSDVLREYAVSLLAAGRVETAIPVLRDVIERSDDPSMRLALARAYRDAGAWSAASDVYRGLAVDRPQDVDLRLEWARALYWARRYTEAAEVLDAALASWPSSVALEVERARVAFAAGDVTRAAELLRPLDAGTLLGVDSTAVSLREAVLGAAAPPVVEEPPPPTLLDRAIAARFNGDAHGADSLFRAAAQDSPQDSAVWRAYADFLQYDVADLRGAHDALLRLSALDPGPSLSYRLAQLEIWLGRNDEARQRLEALLEVDSVGARSKPARADVLALLGDLDRWKGDRVSAARRYQAALRLDPDHPGAREGLERMRADLHSDLASVESTGVDGSASSYSDSDGFDRVDLGADWSGVRDAWVWSGRAGSRWIHGFGLDGGATTESGPFLELEGGRWWRWGTVRTGVRLGAQRVVGNGTSPAVGASLRYRTGGGAQLDFGFDHEPAYGVTETLQSAAAEVTQDRAHAAASAPLGRSLSIEATGEIASMRVSSDVLVPAASGNDRILRLQGSLALGRVVRPGVTLGASLSALGYGAASPQTGGRRLFWDPETSLAVGPYVQLRQPLGGSWEGRGRVSAGLARIQERAPVDPQVLPHFSAELGILHAGEVLRAALNLFYGQSRVDGYRAYGMSISLGLAGRGSRSASLEARSAVPAGTPVGAGPPAGGSR